MIDRFRDLDRRREGDEGIGDVDLDDLDLKEKAQSCDSSGGSNDQDVTRSRAST